MLRTARLKTASHRFYCDFVFVLRQTSRVFSLKYASQTILEWNRLMTLTINAHL